MFFWVSENLLLNFNANSFSMRFFILSLKSESKKSIITGDLIIALKLTKQLTK